MRARCFPAQDLGTNGFLRVVAIGNCLHHHSSHLKSCLIHHSVQCTVSVTTTGVRVSEFYFSFCIMSNGYITTIDCPHLPESLTNPAISEPLAARSRQTISARYPPHEFKCYEDRSQKELRKAAKFVPAGFIMLVCLSRPVT
jgi:hypothetical protein